MSRKLSQTASASADTLPDERQQISEIANALESLDQSSTDRPRIEIGASRSLEIPAPLVQVLKEAAEAMAAGAETIRVLPSERELTTSQAADLLGVSRPHLIYLLEQKRIPYRMVGTHRRIPVLPLLEFVRAQQESSARAFQEMIDLSDEAGLYDARGRGGAAR